MIQITGPAIAILLAVGYLGINSIVKGIESLFHQNESGETHEDRE